LATKAKADAQGYPRKRTYHWLSLV
jgi:hypothetical protein